MPIQSRDTSKKSTVTRSQAKKNPTLAKEIEETSQAPFKPKERLEKTPIKTYNIRKRKALQVSDF